MAMLLHHSQFDKREDTGLVRECLHVPLSHGPWPWSLHWYMVNIIDSLDRIPKTSLNPSNPSLAIRVRGSLNIGP
jgi:hypothetical protein